MICPDHPVRMERTSQGMPASIPFFIPNRRLLHITKSVCEPPIVTSPSFPAGNALSGKARMGKKDMRTAVRKDRDVSLLQTGGNA